MAEFWTQTAHAVVTLSNGRLIFGGYAPDRQNAPSYFFSTLYCIDVTDGSDLGLSDDIQCPPRFRSDNVEGTISR